MKQKGESETSNSGVYFVSDLSPDCDFEESAGYMENDTAVGEFYSTLDDDLNEERHDITEINESEFFKLKEYLFMAFMRHLRNTL